MLVINSIEKTRLSADSFSYSGSGVAWKARLVLFLGFALMAGGLAGSVTVMVLKYLFKDYELTTVYMGIANVVANGLRMLRYGFLSLGEDCEAFTNFIAVRLLCGCRRIWRMITPIILCCKGGSGSIHLAWCCILRRRMRPKQRFNQLVYKNSSTAQGSISLKVDLNQLLTKMV